jgi:hypothetical protein
MSAHHRSKGKKKRKICYDQLFYGFHHGNAKGLNDGSKAHIGRKVAQQRNTSRVRNPKNDKKVKYFGPIHTLLSLPDQGGDVYKVWFRSVEKCGYEEGTH